MAVAAFEKNTEMSGLMLMSMQKTNAMAARIKMFICFLFIFSP
jgi:hypothetical protein